MKKKKNSGFTLIELIIVFAIIAVMATAISTFISAGTYGFGKGSRNAKTQIELQRISDQVQDLILDTNYCLNVNDGTNDPLNPADVPSSTKVDAFKYVKDSDYIEDKDTGRKVHVELKWDKIGETLSYVQKEQKVSEIQVDNVLLDGGIETKSTEVIGTGITNFQVDATKAAAEGKVEVYLEVRRGGTKMNMIQTVSLRNKTEANVAGFDMSQYPKKYNRVTLTIVYTPKMATNTQKDFTCNISGYVRNTDLKWEIIDGTDTDQNAAWRKSYFIGETFHARGTGPVTIQATALGDPSSPQGSARVTFYVG